MKFILGLAMIALSTSAHAATVADSGFEKVIAKHVAKETAQEAVKVANAVRAEVIAARKKKGR